MELDVPEILIHSELNLERKITISHSINGFDHDMFITFPFIYETLYFNGINQNWPWQKPEESVANLLAIWGELRVELEVIQQNRDRKASIEPMKKAIMIFYCFLFWSNDQPVSLKHRHLESLQVKPVNFIERLQFILKRPGLYHSYRQLSELFDEQQKHYMKKKIVAKQNRS